MSILNNIVSIMDQKGITQRALCDHLGLGRQAVSEWKSGRNQSYLKYLPKISTFLGIDIDSIETDATEDEIRLLDDSNMTNNKTIKTIIELLKEKGLQQKDLTDYLNIHKTTFTSWKRGTSNSYLKCLPEIAKFLNVTPDYLLGYTSEITGIRKPTREELKFGLFGDAAFDDDALEEVMRTAEAIKSFKAKKGGK